MRELTYEEYEHVSGNADVVLIAGEIIGATVTIAIGAGIALSIAALTIPMAIALTAAVYLGGYAIGWGINFAWS